MDIKKIKVYDLDAFFRKEANLSSFRYEKAAIFEGPRGVVLAEEEAVHKKRNLLTDTVRLQLSEIPEPNHIALFPTKEVIISLEDLKQAPFTEMTIEEFFSRRNYNPRCQDNYMELMSSLREIGFDLHGYFDVGQPSLNDQIRGAEQKAAAGSKDKGNQKTFEQER